MALKAILHGKLAADALSASLEDVLTATVIGAISYGPPALVSDWLHRVAGATTLGANATFSFWPQHRLGSGIVREPDVFIAAGSATGAIIVEAKLDADPASGSCATKPWRRARHIAGSGRCTSSPSRIAP